MKIEKRNNHKKKLIIGGLIVTSILTTVLFSLNYSKYEITKNPKLSEGIINKNGLDINLIGMYLINKDNTETKIDVVPGNGYVLNEEKTKCTVNNIEIAATIEYKDNKLYFGDITEKETKCKVYFEHKANASDTILGSTTVKPGTDSFTGPATTVEDSGLFSTQDDDGITYYYRGVLSDDTINNWVDFAGFKWRIIRINGDGSIRMIYNGLDYSQTGAGTQIGTKPYNDGYTDNMYVGFRYTSGQVHGTGTPSTILGADNSTDATTLNGFYNTKIKGTKYEQYIDQNAGFCNDRTPSTSISISNGSGGTGSTTTYYGPYIRLKADNTYTSTQKVTTKCNIEDLFTVKTSNKGNKSLANPIGLITADEVVYTGGFSGATNSNYWLYTNQYYWTMSPSGFYSSYALVFQIYANGFLDNGRVSTGVNYTTPGVRPVINLASDVQLTGSGTTTDPFRIVS